MDYKRHSYEFDPYSIENENDESDICPRSVTRNVSEIGRCGKRIILTLGFLLYYMGHKEWI